MRTIKLDTLFGIPHAGPSCTMFSHREKPMSNWKTMKVPAQDGVGWRLIVWEQQRTEAYAGIDGEDVPTFLPKSPPLPFHPHPISPLPYLFPSLSLPSH